jgi:hypothetical protein
LAVLRRRAFNPEVDRIANVEQRQLAGDSKYCRPN